MIRDTRGVAGVALVLALAGGATAQQFVQETGTRFPGALNEYTNQVTLADFDHDGDVDIAWANGGNFGSPGSPQVLRLYVNDGTGVFADESAARTGGLAGNIRDVQFGDVDGDGDLDMVCAQDFNKLPFLYLNDGSGHFTDASGNLPNKTIASSHVAMGDVDNDGDLDLAFNNGTSTRFGAGPTQLYLNDGSGTFTDATATNLPNAPVSQPMDCNFADIDNDLDLDLIVASRSTSTRVFFNDGSGVFSLGAWPGDGSTYSFDFGDYNNDGDLDILGVNSGSGSREALYDNDGSGVFVDVSATQIPGANNPGNDDNDSKFFELDFDGFLDLTVCRLGGSNEKIWHSDAGVFMLDNSLISPQSDSSLDVEMADFDGDGDLDMVTAQGESGVFTNRIYINTGEPKDTLAPRIVDLEQVADGTKGDATVRANVRDDNSSDTGAWIDSVVIEYSVDGGATQQAAMAWMGHQLYRGRIPGAAEGSTVAYSVIATDMAGNPGQSGTLEFVSGGGGCAADCDGSGSLNILDFVCFQNEWTAQTPAGDCDGNGSYNILDFVCFQDLFTAGCP